MVASSSSAAAQAVENEKRKKHTMEKVKVNHLSMQLQMRLQYARLKVEHGWQKQNLNEVENLYFHNSHLRGGKSYPAPTIVAAQSQPPPFPPAQLSFSQSRLSFRYDPTPARNSKPAETNLGAESSSSYVTWNESSSTKVSQPPVIVDHPNSATAVNLSTGYHLNDPNDGSLSMHVDIPQHTLSSSVTPTPGPSLPSGSNENVTKIPDDDMSTTRSSTASPQDGLSPIDVSQISINHYPSVKNVRPRPTKIPAPGSRPLTLLTTKDLFNFGSSSALTYDSFWSSHSGSNTPRLSRPSQSVAPTEFTPSFQVPGDFTSGIQDRNRTTSTFTSSFLSSSGATAAPVHLEMARNPGGPT